jgi:hypothetical protein
MDVENTLSIAELMRSLQRDDGLALSILYRLSDLGPDDLAEFCQGWDEVGEERRRIIIRHLADITEENFQVDFTNIFAFCLGDKAPAVRLAALDGLWDAERPALVEPLVRLMLADPDEEVRTLASATIGHFILLAEWDIIPLKSTDQAIEALLSVMDEPETPSAIYRAALESLSPSSHERVPSLVEDAYDSGDHKLQISAIYAMGRTANKRWLPIILDEMVSSSLEMRVEAARAAGGIGNQEAVSELADLVADEDLEVRLAAVTAMGQIGGRLAIGILEQMDGDPDFADAQFAIEEAIEEGSGMNDIDLSLLDWDNDRKDEGFLTV